MMPTKFVQPKRVLHDRARGCILAGAVGDAMGGPYEGQPGPLQFREHSDWKISDDSQLTLATCESITALAKVSPEHIAAHFVQWFRDRRITGMGSSTLKALRDLDAGAHWALTGAKGEMSAGNGAAMRIAPLALHLDPALAQDRQTIREVCRITHHNEEAYVGALAIVAAVRSLAFNTSSPDQLFETVLSYLPDSRVRDRIVELDALTDENAKAMGAMAEVAKEQDVELHYLPEQRATEWWRYMRVKQRIEDAVKEDIYVPSQMILMTPARQLFTMILWPKGIAQFFPPCDQVYVQRERKRIFGTKEEIGLVPYQSVIATIEPFLDDYEFGDLRIKYLRPEKQSNVAGLIETLRLEAVDLKQYRQIAPDSFNDVAAPGEVPK